LDGKKADLEQHK